MEPRKGDRVKFRFRVYDGPDFKKLLRNAGDDPSVEFVVGAGKVWAWLETAMEDMTVGDARQVDVPIKIAEEAKNWLSDPNAAKSLYVEIRLVSLERVK
jgi:FKBP-type peptidyl-prolyl cis-trans isomerase 2